LGGILTTHAAGSATMPLIAFCSFLFRVVSFIIDDLKKKKKKEKEEKLILYFVFNLFAWLL